MTNECVHVDGPLVVKYNIECGIYWLLPGHFYISQIKFDQISTKTFQNRMHYYYNETTNVKKKLWLRILSTKQKAVTAVNHPENFVNCILNNDFARTTYVHCISCTYFVHIVRSNETSYSVFDISGQMLDYEWIIVHNLKDFFFCYAFRT